MSRADTTRKWLVRWLYAAAVAHLLAGVLLPWIADAAFLDGYHRGITASFWDGAAPAPAMAQQAWWMALFGPTVQTVGIWMIALVHIADRQRSASAWAWLAAGIAVWAPQDMLISLHAAVWANIRLDCFAIAALLPPLAWLWRHDSAAARRAERQPSEEAIVFSARKQGVLLTGATGFIGQRLVAALLRDGHDVTILTRTPQQGARLFDGAVRCIRSMDELHASTCIDVVVNLAGARILGWRWTAKRKAALRRSRAALTDGVVAWIARAEHKPRLMLSASAIGYYGVQAMGDLTPLDETAPQQAIFMSQLCREWEAAARKAEQHGVQVACMRFGLVFGAQGALPMMLLPIKLGMGGPMGGGRQRMSWIHVDDVLGGIAHLWRLSEGGGRVQAAYNFTAPEQVSQAEFSRTAAALLARPCFVPTPAWPMRLMLGEQAALLLEGQTVVPARLLAEGFRFRYPALRGALAAVLRG